MVKILLQGSDHNLVITFLTDQFVLLNAEAAYYGCAMGSKRFTEIVADFIRRGLVKSVMTTKQPLKEIKEALKRDYKDYRDLLGGKDA